MTDTNKKAIPALALIIVLVSACNMPTTSPTEISSLQMTDTPSELSSEPSGPETSGEPVSADELGEVFDLALDPQGKLAQGQ